MSLNIVEIPYDIYESEKEMVIVLPLAGVQKKDIHISLTQYELSIQGVRTQPILKEDLIVMKEDCYWGGFKQVIKLPQGVFFEKIHSHFGGDNILTITVPKLQIPDSITISIE